MNIADFDPELYQAMSNEVVRQEEHIELIASENYCSPRVLKLKVHNLLTNTLKVTQVSVTTVVVNMLISLSN